MKTSLLRCLAISQNDKFVNYCREAYELVALFLNYDVRVNIEIGTATSLAFPAITICNTNKLRLSEIEKSEQHQDLAKTDPEHPDSVHRLLSYEVLLDGHCLPGDYRCLDGKRCIKPHLKCDGYYHCWDGYSDEVNCSYPPCGDEEFNCGRAGFHGICIPREKLCNGVHDCIDGIDELKCTTCPDGVTCDFENDGRTFTCLPLKNQCDRFPDCEDGTDEKNCDLNDQCPTHTVHVWSSPEVLFSVNYPSNYDYDYRCSWILSAFSSKCILVSFLDLDIEPSEDCRKDYIEVSL
ncbi:low-density lipoprotein receptor-related protein 5-like [Ptychodera flava]|uniref:low-density lipoprotein receptor-related protein 5-like n=1 Tax=Ptychodera flava TaxID=63121 RepID=UPI003969E0B0